MATTAVRHFDAQYQRLGPASQRSYPNEELCRFIGRRYGMDGRPKGLRALEVGCGSGANLWMLAKEGFEAHGIDSSPTALRLCRNLLKLKWGVRAALRKGVFSSLPYPDAHFDCVIDVVSLQHQTLAGHARALAEISRVLKPAGRFFSYHLNPQSYPFRHHGSKKLDAWTVAGVKNPKSPFDGVGVTCFLPARQYERLARKAGLKDFSAERVVKTYARGTISVSYLAAEASR